MGYPRSPAAIEAQLAAIAAAHPAICTRTILPNETHEHRKVSMVKIGKGAGPRRVVIIAGGHHAREWAPPDILLSLVDRLLKAYDTDTALAIPAFTDHNASPPSRPFPPRAIRAIPRTTSASTSAGSRRCRTSSGCWRPRT